MSATVRRPHERQTSDTSSCSASPVAAIGTRPDATPCRLRRAQGRAVVSGQRRSASAPREPRKSQRRASAAWSICQAPRERVRADDNETSRRRGGCRIATEQRARSGSPRREAWWNDRRSSADASLGNADAWKLGAKLANVGDYRIRLDHPHLAHDGHRRCEVWRAHHF